MYTHTNTPTYAFVCVNCNEKENSNNRMEDADFDLSTLFEYLVTVIPSYIMCMLKLMSG